MDDFPHLPNDRTGIHVPLLIVALSGFIIVGVLIVAAVWAVIRFWSWFQI